MYCTHTNSALQTRLACAPRNYIAHLGQGVELEGNLRAQSQSQCLPHATSGALYCTVRFYRLVVWTGFIDRFSIDCSCVQGVELKGNLRTEPEEVFAVLQAGLQERYPDMYVVYMMPDAEATDAQSDGRSRVLFQVLPKVVGYPTQGGGWTTFAALLLFFLTVGSMVRCSRIPVLAVPLEVVVLYC